MTEKYESFLQKQTNLISCDIQYFIELKKKEYSIYVPPSSGNQIYQYFYLAMQYERKEEWIFMIYQLFSYFLGHLFSKQLILWLHDHVTKNKKITDKQVYSYIEKNREKSRNSLKKTLISLVCKETSYSIQYTCHQFLSFCKIDPKTFHMLDVGCGNGYKTMSYAKGLGLSMKNVHGADISSWGPYSENKTQFPFSFHPIQKNKIGLPNESMNLIIANLTLHHVEDLEELVHEITRILKKNGFLLIIENDSMTDFDKMLYDIQHAFYSNFFDHRKNFLEHPDYIKTINRMEWQYLFSKYGFHIVEESYLPFQTEYKVRYDKTFYAFYEKKA